MDTDQVLSRCPCSARTRRAGAVAQGAQGAGVVSRRRALGLVAAGMALLLAPPRAWARKLAIRLERVPQLRRVGAFVILRLEGREVLLARSAEHEFLAFPATCPHQRTRLAYDHRVGQVVCPQHGSRFARDGRLLKGPAPRGLGPPLPARLDAAGDRILLDV